MKKLIIFLSLIFGSTSIFAGINAVKMQQITVEEYQERIKIVEVETSTCTVETSTYDVTISTGE